MDVLWIFLKLGCTSFGGPVAHLGYFRNAFVERRGWLSEAAYADLVALCQFLPGPASSQVGFAIGLGRAGIPGALAAWLGFTLPSAALMLAFALGVGAVGDALGGGWIAGLKLAAVAVVANALLGMARTLCPDRSRATLAVAALCTVVALPGVWGQVGAILAAGLAGRLFLRAQARESGHGDLPVSVGRTTAIACLVLFFLLLGGLPLAAAMGQVQAVQLLDAFYRAGALVFGGGHVVLPLLQAEMVPTGLVGAETFLAGYGAAQALPGPLFSFSAFLGGSAGGVVASLVALGAIFLPGCLLVIGTLPFWARLRARTDMRAALMGVNAGVVGLLAAAFYDPVWTSAVHRPADVAVAAGAFLLLAVWKVSPVFVVGLGAVAGILLGAG
ncbi:chromate transporter [Rhodovibrio salinarum]|uniref:Chromate transporter n=1 Tax=Rhodovibrio salinarum TaxID=1087 RepID=A0A934QKB2_9PROT|nr:chromate efflux transporter [Rhodovibrio salinarum]MBK1698481.1 chromate transporter [Rhodovibrio salinarum]